MSSLSFLLDTAGALLIGVAIGAERQFRRHPAGLRTNALVCVGAALFVSMPRLIGATEDPTRMAATVVSGLGFLGGGVILREGLNLRGLNTAATLWCSGAVGALSGAGFQLSDAPRGHPAGDRVIVIAKPDRAGSRRAGRRQYEAVG